MLLPLRVRDRRETLHEDVRPAPVPEPLVGRLVPQEELDSKRIVLPNFKPGIQKDEPRRRGSPLVSLSSLPMNSI